MIFNLLHIEAALDLLAERIVSFGPVVLAIIHWRRDIQTPRGPRWQSAHREINAKAGLSKSDSSLNLPQRLKEIHGTGAENVSPSEDEVEFRIASARPHPIFVVFID
ncbi:MAG: hypothetical protein R3C56_34215 [Pirellulaceae bacterium]